VAFTGSDSRNLVHYLHDGGHEYRFGSPPPFSPLPRGISVPAFTMPGAVDDVAWQSDASSSQWRHGLFDWLQRAR
jgi:hypothetical protein